MNACLLVSLLSIFFPLLLVHAAEDKSSWQVEWGKTVQLAKKEGQLVNYDGEEIIHPEILKFDGKIDFISGNHITPYARVGQGKPIVCLASPSNNGVR